MKVSEVDREHFPERDPQSLSHGPGSLFGFTASAGMQHPSAVGRPGGDGGCRPVNSSTAATLMGQTGQQHQPGFNGS